MKPQRAILAAARLCVPVILMIEAAQASGFGSFFARVAASGTVQRSLGVASSVLTTTGVYQITFNRPINTCGWVASLNGPIGGYATAMVGATAQTLTVMTFSAAGAKANRPFSVVVNCGP